MCCGNTDTNTDNVFIVKQCLFNVLWIVSDSWFGNSCRCKYISMYYSFSSILCFKKRQTFGSIMLFLKTTQLCCFYNTCNIKICKLLL